ncbi:MAG: hypothetical protein GY940_12360, partial [bacterium]|nr:hypothetical protein [bacterium]
RGGVEQKTPAHKQAQYSLTDQQLNVLCRMGRRIEDHFGRPQDIEWALGPDKTFFILQARPITTK